MKGIYRFCFLITGVLLTLFGCKGKQEPKALPSNTPKNQSIALNINSEPQTLDPRRMRTLNDINLSKMFFEGLTRIGKSGKAELALAEKIDISSDCKSYTITLRQAEWSNGKPITTKDFIYAWKSSLSPSFIAPNANMLYVLKNAKAIKLGELPSSLLGVNAIDDKTMIIELKHPVPYFLELISHPIFFPVCAKLDRTSPNWAMESGSFVGNGPFSLCDWKHHDWIEARKNYMYWDAKSVKLDAIKLIMVTTDTGLKLFEAKELNWEGSPFSCIPTDAIHTLRQKKQLETSSSLATCWIRVNTERFPFHSQKMRKAFGLAINRQALIDHVIQGNQTIATGIVPNAMGLSTEPYFEDGNSKKAIRLFQEALQEEGLTLGELPYITLFHVASDLPKRIAQALQDQWQQAFGITIELASAERQIFFDRIGKKDYMLSIGQWFADFNDPINFLEVFKSKTVGVNNTNWENPHYIELLEKSYLCSEPEVRKSILKESEQILIKEMPVIPLYNHSMLYVKDENLEDVVLTSMAMIDFKWAYLRSPNIE